VTDCFEYSPRAAENLATLLRAKDRVANMNFVLSDIWLKNSQKFRWLLKL